MSWIKLDDQFADHPKVVEAGPLASWLYICGLTYAGRYLTDGFIPIGQVRKLADVDNPTELSGILVRVGMWEEVDGGYIIHDYLDYNPRKADVLATRQARAEAGSLGGQASVQAKAQAKAQANEEQNSTPSPSPSPSPSSDSVPSKDIAADKPPRPKSQKAEQNETRLALEVYFADTTGLPRPKSDTEQQRRSAGTLWWGPLRDIAELCAWNVQEATDLIDKSLERLSGMTISSPKSILQTALAIYSESNRTRPDSADYLCPICNSSPCRCEKHEQSPEEIAAGKLHDRWILIEPQLRALNVLGLFNGRELVGEDNGKLVVRVKSRELLDAKPELLRRITSAGIAIEGEKNDETR